MFYLKFRPQKVEELDLEEIRQKLSEILRARDLPHAFLFSGPKGAGKTSAARILAKAVNCQRRRRSTLRVKFEPCNRCSICKAVTAGTALDLIEIDAASNRGIDDIRDLREKIKLTPSQTKYKVYVIDEAHMLTKEAFNALLKTLEEPPEHAIFILCTTEPEKLPETIISRCLHLQFRKGTLAEIKRSLERVIKKEKIKIEPKAVEAMAAAADGSFRDGQKLLEQLAMKRKMITAAMVEEEVGRSGKFSGEKLLKFLGSRQVKEAIEEINQRVEMGVNLEEYNYLLLEKLREMLLASVGFKNQDSRIKALTELFSKREIAALIDLFELAGRNLKTAVIPQLPLEMAAVAWCLAEKNLLRKKVDLKKNPVLKTHSGIDVKEISDNWEEILKRIRPYNHSVEGLLRSAKPLNFNGRILTIEVFYPFHQERLNTEKNRRLIEEVVSRVMKRGVGIKCVLGTKINKS